MALLSRSSLRGSVRQAPQAHSDNNGLEPPMKRPRTQHANDWSRHRKSSPDCLDTSTPEVHPNTGKARHANPPLKPSRPSTRRTRRRSSSSTSSVDTAATSTQLTPPDNLHANGRDMVKNARSAADLLQGSRESPDPLDTISPVTNHATIKPQAAASGLVIESKAADSPAVSTRTTRRTDRRTATGADGGDGTEDTKTTVTHPVGQDAAGKTRSAAMRRSDVSDQAQPALVRTGSERRSLRSTDSGFRCKSELAQYFNNYEQLIGLEDPQPEFLAANTNLTLINDLSEPLPLPSSPDPTPFGNPLLNLHDCEEISIAEPAVSPSVIDPMGEETYFRVHRKFERQEKQLRNIERDRAQHEKQQLDRLLAELCGHDWLRVMGLTGVHESEKKQYEPKRQLLIQELVALVNKFQIWKDEERRRKLAREKPAPTPEIESHPPSRRSRKRSLPVDESAEADSSSGPGTDAQSTPDPNDVDAWAARQLQHEALSASAASKRRKSVSTSRKSKSARMNHDGAHSITNRPAESKSATKPKKAQADSKPTTAATHPVLHFDPLPPDKPFVSFFAQRHLREAAVAAAKGTRRGRSRSILAFGNPIPGLVEREFELPPEILTEDAIQSSQRKRRRLNRQSRGD